MSETSQALVIIVNGQIVAGNEFRLALEALRIRALAVEFVRDKESCAEALELVAKGNSHIKEIEAAAEPERLRLQNALNELRSQRDKMIEQVETITEPLEKQAREWSIAERQAAQKEQDQVNKGQRAENRVTVKPSLPSVPGARVMPRYRVEVVNLSKVKREWMTPDLQRIGEAARKDKAPKVTENKVGGIRVHVE